jgi:hypothetical protein
LLGPWSGDPLFDDLTAKDGVDLALFGPIAGRLAHWQKNCHQIAAFNPQVAPLHPPIQVPGARGNNTSNGFGSTPLSVAAFLLSHHCERSCEYRFSPGLARVILAIAGACLIAFFVT